MIKLAKYLIDRPVLHIVLLYTWGLLTSLIGLIVSGLMLIVGKTPHKFGHVWYFEVGRSWGGLSLGCMFLMSTDINKEWALHIKQHEYGHTYQNALFGPFFLTCVMIPSAIRYWYQEIRSSRGLKNKEYDAIWFEGSATQIGEIAWNKSNLK